MQCLPCRSVITNPNTLQKAPMEHPDCAPTSLGFCSVHCSWSGSRSVMHIVFPVECTSRLSHTAEATTGLCTNVISLTTRPLLSTVIIKSLPSRPTSITQLSRGDSELIFAECMSTIGSFKQYNICVELDFESCIQYAIPLGRPRIVIGPDRFPSTPKSPLKRVSCSEFFTPSTVFNSTKTGSDGKAKSPRVNGSTVCDASDTNTLDLLPKVFNSQPTLSRLNIVNGSPVVRNPTSPCLWLMTSPSWRRNSW